MDVSSRRKRIYPQLAAAIPSGSGGRFVLTGVPVDVTGGVVAGHMESISLVKPRSLHHFSEKDSVAGGNSLGPEPSAESPEKVFGSFLQRKRCRYTPQRKAIVAAFWSAGGHLTVEELFARVHSLSPSVGQSTVYRTMRLLCEAGLAREVSFGRGVVRYERASAWHHDHIICERCGRSIEFIDTGVDTLGRRVARRYGFTLRQHRLYLYGLCAGCRAADADSHT